MYIHVETQPKLFLYCVARINSLIHVAYICSFLTIHLPVSFPLFFFISNLLQNQFKLIFNSINSDVKYTTLPLKKQTKKQTKTKLNKLQTQCHLKRWSEDCDKNSSDRKTFSQFIQATSIQITTKQNVVLWSYCLTQFSGFMLHISKPRCLQEEFRKYSFGTRRNEKSQ